MTDFFDKDISREANVENIIVDCLTAILCPFGKFYPDKNYGNSIRRGVDVGELLAGARQATDSINGVYIKSAEIKNGTIEFTIIVNDEKRSVSVSIEQNI